MEKEKVDFEAMEDKVLFLFRLIVAMINVNGPHQASQDILGKVVSQIMMEGWYTIHQTRVKGTIDLQAEDPILNQTYPMANEALQKLLDKYSEINSYKPGLLGIGAKNVETVAAAHALVERVKPLYSNPTNN